MRDFAHLAAGLAWTSCLPGAVAAGASGNPAYFVLGAASGLLADFIDSWLAGFGFKHDIEIVPDPAAPNHSQTAAALALAIEQASAAGPKSVRLHPIRLCDNAWLAYDIFFDARLRAISVTPGPVVDDWSVPRLEQPPVSNPGRCGFTPRIRLGSRARISVDSCRDVVVRMEPAADGSVTPRIGPPRPGWYRDFLVALLAGLSLAAAAGPLAGAVAGGAIALNSLLDRLTRLKGSVLAFLVGRPVPDARGLPDSVADSAAVAWFSALLVLWNLYPAAGVRCPALHFARIIAAAAVIPFLAMLFLRRLPAGERS